MYLQASFGSTRVFLATLHILSRLVVESAVVRFLILVNCVPEMLKLFCLLRIL